MRAGNQEYHSVQQLPDIIPVFPLAGALLLPGSPLPLNVFEPRYLEMFEDALASERIIGIIQPEIGTDDEQSLCAMGCLGRITAFEETGDGRYHLQLSGICRFRPNKEMDSKKPYRCFTYTVQCSDFEEGKGADEVDREALLAALDDYLRAHDMEADWENIQRADNDLLVNSLAIMSPFGPAEKQALLEAPDLKTRSDILVAMTQIALAEEGVGGSQLQ